MESTDTTSIESTIAHEVETHQNTGPEYDENWPYSVGAKIVATQSSVEEYFPQTGTTHTHASPGDIGTIVFIERGEGPGPRSRPGAPRSSSCTGVPTARFHKSGSATIVFEHEVSFAPFATFDALE